ncbi:MAG: hypothetical protein ACI8P0_001563 [Planctomycetaceae bacterium]|jgi:hypothetical protein
MLDRTLVIALQNSWRTNADVCELGELIQQHTSGAPTAIARCLTGTFGCGGGAAIQFAASYMDGDAPAEIKDKLRCEIEQGLASEFWSA